MNLLIKITTPFLIISLVSCSFLNDPAVVVTVDSEPSGAKVYVDNVFYGNTTKEIKVIPDRNHDLKFEKDGYKTVNIEMKTRFSMRKGREGASKCRLDLVGWFLIAPLWGLKSLYCRSFTEELYSVELSPIATAQSPENTPNPQGYIPFSNHNYYLPPQAQQDNQNINSNTNSNTNSNPPAQPIFNNQSEFINNGNEASLNQNFNHEDRIDYYNWQ